MKIYTKTGDEGETGLYTGERLPKDSQRVEAYGIIDEVNSALGMSRALAVHSEVKSTIYSLQKLLEGLMADIASIDSPHRITADQIKKLEEMIDYFDSTLPPLTNFIVPGDTQSGAALDLARTITRRAERQLLRLSREEFVSADSLIFLNRLSDLCFVLARVESK